MVAAVGNDGKLMRPYIVQSAATPTTASRHQPQQMGQPISPRGGPRRAGRCWWCRATTMWIRSSPVISG